MRFVGGLFTSARRTTSSRLPDQRPGRRHRRHRLGRHHLAHRAGAHRPRRRGVRRAEVRRHRQADVTGGMRYFEAENSLEGLLRLRRHDSVRHRAPARSPCFDTGQVFDTAPCTNLDKTVKDDDSTSSVQRHLPCHRRRDVYATWSRASGPAASTAAARSRRTSRTSSPTTRSAGRPRGPTTACASTARSSATTGTTSSSRSSARTA